MSHVAHQYSRVDFYSSLEVNLSLYYGGVGKQNEHHRFRSVSPQILSFHGRKLFTKVNHL